MKFPISAYGMHQFWRKNYVMRVNLTPRKVFNTARRVFSLVTGNPDVGGVPVHIKVDVSPNCQMRCPICLHSKLSHPERVSLPKPMELQTFMGLVDQVAGRTLAMSLYNLGEPLLNKNLAKMLRYAADANINTYITSNFSLPLSDEAIRELAESGLTQLIIAIDGLSPETFGQQRIRGDLDIVENNLRRLVQFRKGKHPLITLQYLVFDHNSHEVPLLEDYRRRMGIDDMLVFRGSDGRKHPWVDRFAPRKGWRPWPKKRMPLCGWPYLSALVATDGHVYGCCHYRMEENYLHRDTARPLGNIHKQSMDKIYASPAYKEARQLSADPGRHGPMPDHFCHGCKILQDHDDRP
ncbi:radical SAM protein [Novosphingobium sediminicola]|uniref:MoaA/NifB/PqqE/SkfB family radical SAM enzyme n=1 Tax=Novosphingobium sediminicola TaxID=563162 RepID=A0A7W6CIY0_9SPHN|nr:radical SAM protein [Novosphingobium sediminicola]MBB3955504.1 MoaA/NifB/PqqE/SkfB family radical SAM enzyme [Novosphingobium sediminicola]